MQSRQKTTVAVLRQKLGLTVEQFAALIEKSVSAINSLETGRLGLSEESAFRISEETGVLMEWLLDASPEEEPVARTFAKGYKRHWTKDIFEEIQARKHSPSFAPLKDRLSGFWYVKDLPAWRLVRALHAIGRWVSIYCWAEKKGKRELACYLMNRFLDSLAERLGTDDAGASRLCQNARLVLKDGSEWGFEAEAGQLNFRYDPDNPSWKKDKP